MARDKKLLLTSFVAAATYLTLPAATKAVTYTETGDAGQTLATAANTNLVARPGATGLTGINGTIGTSADADLYVFTVANAISFTASAVGGASSTGNGQIDTSLFLFNSTGGALLANDDQSNTSYQASITINLNAGTYYLGISLSGNEAVNSNNQLLFTVDQPTTAQRGAASGLNPATLSTFNGNTFFPETGPYGINITSVLVPEPSTWAALSLGAGALALVLRRRRAV